VTVRTVVTTKCSTLLKGELAYVRIILTSTERRGHEYPGQRGHYCCPGTNSRTFSLPRAWVTANVIPEHFRPCAVRSSVWCRCPRPPIGQNRCCAGGCLGRSPWRSLPPYPHRSLLDGSCTCESSIIDVEVGGPSSHQVSADTQPGSPPAREVKSA